jgi:elongation factor Ts
LLLIKKALTFVLFKNMAISIDQIKKLRQETKAGVMEVRQALTETNGDMEKAKQWLIEKRPLQSRQKIGQRNR